MCELEGDDVRVVSCFQQFDLALARLVLLASGNPASGAVQEDVLIRSLL